MKKIKDIISKSLIIRFWIPVAIILFEIGVLLERLPDPPADEYEGLQFSGRVNRGTGFTKIVDSTVVISSDPDIKVDCRYPDFHHACIQHSRPPRLKPELNARFAVLIHFPTSRHD